jgi:hypothetical protein
LFRWRRFGVVVFKTRLVLCASDVVGLSRRQASTTTFHAPPAKSALRMLGAALRSNRIVTARRAGEHSSSATPSTWSSTQPTLPSARANVRHIPPTAIERNRALTQLQRSTGPMRRRGSSTATATGCGRYVAPPHKSVYYGVFRSLWSHWHVWKRWNGRWRGWSPGIHTPEQQRNLC